MRWEGQRGCTRQPAERQLSGMEGFVRSVRTPDLPGLTVHEVRASSVLNRVPGTAATPFDWTIDPYRGRARRRDDRNAEVTVTVNAAQVLAHQLASPWWRRRPVALGTCADPYQRAEGRYELLPGIIEALADSRTPFSILTKSTLLSRDIASLVRAARRVPVGIGVSIPLLDRELAARLEPDTAAPQARLELVRKLRAEGLPCGVFVAPVLPGLTDSRQQLDDLLAAIAEAGATGVSVQPLHLRPGAREWFARWLSVEHPELVDGYRRLYGSHNYVDRRYHRWLRSRVLPLVQRHGWTATSGRSPAGALPAGAAAADVSRAGPLGVSGAAALRWPAGSLPELLQYRPGVEQQGVQRQVVQRRGVL